MDETKYPVNPNPQPHYARTKTPKTQNITIKPNGDGSFTDGNGHFFYPNGSMLRDQNGVNYQKNGDFWTPIR